MVKTPDVIVHEAQAQAPPAPTGPAIGDIRTQPIPGTNNVALQEWNGYSWETIDILSTPAGTGAGTGAVQTAEEAQLLQAQAIRLAQQAEEERLRREQEERIEAARIAEEKRQSLLASVTTLLEGRRSSKDIALGRASEQAGQDVFRFLANLKGQRVPEGTLTPIDIFKQQNAAIAQAQLPQISPNASIADLESAVSKLQTMQQQEEAVRASPLTFGGFAGGGTIGPAGTRFGTNKTAVLVGDARINGDEEVLIHDRATGQAEVIPLEGRAQAGATTLPANLTVLPQLFETLRSNVSTFGGAPGGGTLGYLRPPLPGQPPTPAQFGTRGALATPLTLERGLTESLNYTPEEAKRLSDLIGILPAPHKLGPYARGLLPAERAALASAYRLAGFPEADLTEILEENVVRGPERTGVSLR